MSLNNLIFSFLFAPLPPPSTPSSTAELGLYLSLQHMLLICAVKVLSAASGAHSAATIVNQLRYDCQCSLRRTSTLEVGGPTDHPCACAHDAMKNYMSTCTMDVQR